MPEDKKKVYSQWIVNALLSLLLIAYGFIFSSVVSRIDKVEAKVENFNSMFLQIQTDLAEIKVDLKWIKNK